MTHEILTERPPEMELRVIVNQLSSLSIDRADGERLRRMAQKLIDQIMTQNEEIAK